MATICMILSRLVDLQRMFDRYSAQLSLITSSYDKSLNESLLQHDYFAAKINMFKSEIEVFTGALKVRMLS
jgi:hypothetical protein